MRNWILSLKLYLCNHIVSHVPSHSIRLAFYRHVMNISVESGSSIYLGAFIDTPGGLLIGSDTTINGRCRLDTRGGITIGDCTSIAMDVALLTADHDLQSPDFADRLAPITIGRHVFIGTGTMVLPGITLGHGSAVAARAVVTQDVAPGSIVAGIPARVIGHREPKLRYSARYRRPMF